MPIQRFLCYLRLGCSHSATYALDVWILGMPYPCSCTNRDSEEGRLVLALTGRFMRGRQYAGTAWTRAMNMEVSSIMALLVALAAPLIGLWLLRRKINTKLWPVTA